MPTVDNPILKLPDSEVFSKDAEQLDLPEVEARLSRIVLRLRKIREDKAAVKTLNDVVE